MVSTLSYVVGYQIMKIKAQGKKTRKINLTSYRHPQMRQDWNSRCSLWLTSKEAFEACYPSFCDWTFVFNVHNDLTILDYSDCAFLDLIAYPNQADQLSIHFDDLVTLLLFFIRLFHLLIASFDTLIFSSFPMPFNEKKEKKASIPGRRYRFRSINVSAIFQYR